jgi:hypothetical protein
LVKQDKEGHFILIKEAIHQKKTNINQMSVHIISSNIH